MLGGSLLLYLLLFYFFPSPPIRSGEAFSSVIFPLFLFFHLFFGCSDGMEREACVCDHGLERSDLCAEIIIIIVIIIVWRAPRTTMVDLKVSPKISILRTCF